MKKLLIISPYFPPTNAADCHRVRISMPYFEQFGWEVEIVTVNEIYSDLAKDNLLSASVPEDIKIHKVKAFSKRWTSKFGLGSLALRSLWFYFTSVNKLLKTQKFDLIYFSTTQFPVCILGPYWKKKFNIPFVIDMQDPWHTEYYQNKLKNERPSKYWFSYRLNKYLEPITMKNVDGLIAINRAYITELQNRYKNCLSVAFAVIPFCSSVIDFEIAFKNQPFLKSSFNKNTKVKIAYIGAVGSIMKESITKLLTAFKSLQRCNNAICKDIELYFFGTSYAPNGTGKKSVTPIAKVLGLEKFVFEETDRLSYFNALNHLLKSDAVFMVGSDNADYLGSKLYNLLYVNKKIFSLLHENSPANKILKNYHCATMSNIQEGQEQISKKFKDFIMDILDKTTIDNKHIFDAVTMTKQQCNLFNRVIQNKV